MPTFGIESEKQLSTCHPLLVKVARAAIVIVDFSVIEGFRDEAQQTRDFLTGKSKLSWPKGRHNKSPSEAFDFSPYPADWSEAERPHLRFAFIAGVMFGCAQGLGIKLRWGGDFNRNFDPRDESFLDLGHIELDTLDQVVSQ